MSRLNWRIVGIAAAVLFFGWYAVMNFIPAATRKESPLLPDTGIRLGLDLQGGIHWVLGPDLAAALDHELDVLRGGLSETLSEKKITPTRLGVEAGKLTIEAAKPDDLPAIHEAADATKVLKQDQAEGNVIVYELDSRYAEQVKARGIDQMLEVLRRRIDDPIQGVQDSIVTRQGKDRVLIQIPGGQLDRDQARKLLRQTGFLEFKIVIDEAPTEELLRKKHEGGLPPDTEIVFEKEKGTDRIVDAYFVGTSPSLTGESLTDARSATDPRHGWIVNFTLSSDGATKFGKLSGDNIGKRLAIILDGTVASAPVLQGRIGGGHGQITGHFTSQTAADLSVILRAGSLPIPAQIEEERTIGPALGADSIRSGVNACLLGFAMVVGFAIFYYRLSGVYASIGLIVNLLMMLGILSMAKATLTLPGMAGLVLTAGIAIDSNVIIFERIREELRNGKLPRAAIRTGFSKALWTILDANITTLITALVLFQYGTGPVKGFAVTLSIGILTSVFTALAITRLLYDVYPGNRPVQALSI